MIDKDTIMQERQADVDAVNAGEITFAELRKREYIRTKKANLPRLYNSAVNGKWDDFISITLSVYEVMPEAFTYFYKFVPDSLKYDFAISAYTNHGDSIPAVRKAVRGAAKYGKATLPAELKTQDTITVYRAGEEDITKCKYRLSWTTDRSIAEFFLNTYINRHARHLYEAQIRPAEIIAYTDDRKEKEVIQYRKVFNIREITKKEA